MNEQIVDYSFLKTIISDKGLNWQYIEYSTDYSVFAVDSGICYKTTLYKAGSEPIGCSGCAADTIDFETNYKSISNAQVTSAVKFNTMQNIGVTKPVIGTRAWIFSHNFCDKTTWCGDSVRVTDEAIGTGNGATTVFNFDNGYVIDLSNGKITEEDYLFANYGCTVSVDGVVLTETLFEDAGDYTINYVNGVITFTVAPANGLAITSTYSYSPPNAGSTMYVRPNPGKKLIITFGEAQFGQNMVLTDNLVSAAFTYNPGLGAPPQKFEYPGTRARYKKFIDFVNYTLGAFPIIPALDSGGLRGLSQPCIQLRFDYQSAMVLRSDYGTELRLWTEHHRPYNGDYAQVSFYGYEEDL